MILTCCKSPVNFFIVYFEVANPKPNLSLVPSKKTQQKYNYNAYKSNAFKKKMKCMHQEKLSMKKIKINQRMYHMESYFKMNREEQ